MRNVQRKKIKSNFHRGRFIIVCFCISAVFIGLAARAAYIQIIKPDLAINESNKRTLRVKKLHVQRGMIFDRSGKELAVSVPVVSVYVDPKALNEGLVAKVLKQAKKQGENAKLLAKNELLLAKRVKEHYQQDIRWQELADVLRVKQNKIDRRLVGDPTKRFIYLQRQITPAVADYIKRLKLPGIYLIDESKRYYPAGEVTAHVLGFTDIDGKGIEGMEKLFNKALTGTDGRRTYRKDAQGREVEILDERERVEPESINLSIDQRIQAIAYKALKSAVLSYKATSGSAMVVDVKTGEILAMVNSPSFNPNNLSNAMPHKRRNRAITDLFEPGSTVKPLAILAGLEYGTINDNEIVNTSPGYMRMGGSMVRDPRNNGKMTLRQIIQKSSNMGVAKITKEVPKDFVVGLYEKVGFGEDTGTNMIGETSGLFTPRRRWSDFEIATLSFGYALAISTAQLARFYATLGSGGISRPLTILKQDEPMHGERIMAQKNVHAVLEMMESVFEKGGTAPNVKLDGYRVAAKTGTSKKAIAGGYGDEYVNYFAGVGPVSDPRLSIVVMVNEPSGDEYYGATTTGPAFSEIMSGALRILNVAPDLNTVAMTKIGADHG
ncbi:penicillin-binding transpeptidase domain-containing protein [Pseudoalteromonas denitrificans]|uniref:Peptidoglycan D,D-transpeptidase FtsI n=1 Tax=Pseudoalteromonas denitrificans DSM 6059 TaxID=1123010 RepID=A0A1I1QYH6_9GAMM|nr:penicillin-binding transpeptidase domain-containing protein [Pseudoalteromonas denitrificans]SFD23080.1 peptidoglycan synthetase FtsI [Pseudoalteromonas denitrificans DSM 6059]